MIDSDKKGGDADYGKPKLSRTDKEIY